MSDQQLDATLRLNFDGNFANELGRGQNAFQAFGRSGKRHLSIVQRAAGRADRAINRLGNRYVALASGGAVVAATKKIVDFDAQLTFLAGTADIGDLKLKKLKKAILDVANAKNIRVSRGGIFEGIQEIQTQIGNYKLAEDNIENIGLLMRAAGVEGRDAGALIANLFQKFDIESAEEMRQAIEILLAQGDKGSFELRDMATEINSVGAAFASTGRKGLRGVAEMGAMLQLIKRDTPSAAEAATVFERTVQSLTAENAALLKANGIEVWTGKVVKGRKEARELANIIQEVLTAAKNDPEVLTKIFEIRAFKGVRAFINQANDYKDLLSTRSDGSLLTERAARNAQTAQAALTSINNAYFKIADQMLSGEIKDLGDAINDLDVGRLEEIAETTAQWAKALGIGFIAYKTIKIGSGLRGLGKEAAGGALGAAGNSLAPVPVFVVNMAGMGGGMGGPLGLPGPAGSTLPGSKLSRFGTSAMRYGGGALVVTGAGLAAMQFGKLVNHHLKDTFAGNALDSGIESSGIGKLIANLLAGDSVELTDYAKSRLTEQSAKIQFDITPELSRLLSINVTKNPENFVEISGMNMGDL